MTDARGRGLVGGAIALLCVLALAGCGDVSKPRDVGSGDGSGYGVPAK